MKGQNNRSSLFLKGDHICTTVWKKSDYMAAPAMMLKEANEVFDFAMFLHSKACPLSTISLLQKLVVL